jgi:hypothetical protein
MPDKAEYRLFVDSREKGWWEYPVFIELLRHLEALGLRVSFEPIEKFELHLLFVRRSVAMRHWVAIIQRVETGKFWMLDCSDWVTPFDLNIQEFALDNRCQAILKCQFRREPYQLGPLRKIRPWTYFEQNAPLFQRKIIDLRARPRSRDGLFFRGNPAYEGRAAILRALKDSGIVSPSVVSIPYMAYLDEMAQHRIALALPGMGNICHREIECFGSGTPVLMPKLKNTLNDPLIPNFHYISVGTDTGTDTAAVVAERILHRFREIVQWPDYLEFVARNAMAWYDANVRFPASLDLAVKLMGLELPKRTTESAGR